MSAYKCHALIILVVLGLVLFGWFITHRHPPVPVSPEVAFSPQMRSLLSDILDKEHVRQLRLHRHYPTPGDMMDVDESALLDRKDEIVRAATTKGDHILVELLTTLEKSERNGETTKAQELQKNNCRKNIEHLLEQNGLGPVILIPAR